jgi:hypothetical protein
MIQQLIALVVVLAILARLGWQFYKEQIPKSQFILWIVFWFIAGLSVIFIKSIDQLANHLGFSSSGIQLLLYLAILIILYFIFSFRLKIARLEKDITTLTRHLALTSEVKKSKDVD